MSSSTWRVLSGYATYQRTPMRITSGGKWAPLKLIAIVALPLCAPWVTEGDHTPKWPQRKLATKPAGDLIVIGIGRDMAEPGLGGDGKLLGVVEPLIKECANP